MTGRGLKLRTPPTTAEWRQLYEAARLFCQATPWDVLLEDQLFGVEVPQTGETLYCSIIGADGEQLGLNAVRGATGLLAYVQLMSGEMDEDEMPISQNCLTLLLGSRELVTDEDRKVQKELGLRFRGKASWPIFLSLTPNYAPVRPDSAEATALTVALEQGLSFVQDLLAGEPVPQAVDGYEVVGRKQDENGVWRTAVLTLPPPVEPPRLTVDPVRCALILQTGRRSREIWEATISTLGMIEAEDESDAYWARLLLCANRDTKLIEGGEVIGPEESPQEALLAVIEQVGTIPRTLDLTSGVLERELRPLVDVLGIRLRHVERLRVADKARRDMKRALS